MKNAFQIVRPRGAAAVAARKPVPRSRGRDIKLGGSRDVRVLDSNGRPMATLAPRIYGGGPVLSRAQSQAQSDKTRLIVKGGI